MNTFGPGIGQTQAHALGNNRRPLKWGLNRGFTLLELLVAVALMAILAVMSWQGLQSVIQGRDRITEAANEMRALSTAFTQLDQDLRRSWPVRLFNLPRRPIMFLAGASENDPLLLSLVRESVASEALEVQQVVYRLRDDVLERGFGQWSGTSPGELRLDELIWQPLINNVQGIAFRAWVPGTGWLAGEGLLDLAAKPLPAAAPVSQNPVVNQTTRASRYDGPVGIEVTLNRKGETINRLFAVED